MAGDVFFDVHHGNARVSPEALTMDAVRAIKGLGLEPEVAASTLGIDRATVSGLLEAGIRLEPGSGPGRHAFLLVRLHRALGDVFGELDAVHAWLGAYLPELGGKPLELMQRGGLAAVVRAIERRCRDVRAWAW